VKNAVCLVAFLQIKQQLLFYLAEVFGKGIRYEFAAPLWQFAGAGGWHFVSLPKKMSKEIRKLLRSEEQGWGRLPATARIGESEWKTAIWFDTKQDTYLLPVKGDVRKAEGLGAGDRIKTTLWM